MKTGIIWAAVSSASQVENVSLEDQIKIAVQHANQHGVHVAGALIVPGKSRHVVLFDRAATTIEGYLLTPVDIQNMATMPLVDILSRLSMVYPYAELLAALEAKPRTTDVLFFLNRSRLGRTAPLSMAIIGLCRENRVKPYDLESPPTNLDLTDNRDESFVGAFKSVEGENQIIAIQDNHRRGMIKRVRDRGRMPGKVNFGYIAMFDNGKFAGYEIDTDAADTVRLIVDLYLVRGFGALNIADHLNRDGRPAPLGGQWGHSQITFLLRRIWRYAGYAELNVNSATGRPYIRAKGAWPAIITEDQARAVLAEREARNSTRRSVYTVYRFTRMVYCVVCGTRLHSSTKSRSWTKVDGSLGEYSHVSYRCPAEHTSIGEKKIIAAVDAWLKKLDDDTFRESILSSAPGESETDSIIGEMTALQERLEKLTDNVTRADNDYYIRGVLDEARHQAIVSAIKKQATSLHTEITTLQDKLHTVETDMKRGERLEDMAVNGLARLYDPDVRASNAWLRQRLRIYVESRYVIDIAYT